LIRSQVVKIRSNYLAILGTDYLR